MKSDQARQPKGIPEGGRFAGHLHAESSNPGTTDVDPQRGPVFTEEDVAATQYGRAVAIAQRELEELSKSPFRNMLRIRDAKEVLRRLQVGYRNAVTNPAAKNETWHRQHPDAPSWAHPIDFLITALYKETRGFEVVAEGPRPESRLYSPGLDTARKTLHHAQLDAADRATLNRYFHKHDWHDCKDHSQPWSTYWDVQDELHQVTTKIAPMDRPVTVWRGESYSVGQRSILDDSNDRKFARIQYLMNLKPGDPFTWTNCAATSLSLGTAASKFSGKRRPEEFKHVDSRHVGQNVSHSVLFELETDRGVFIDHDLTEAKHSNENEILLPREMQFEVLGHAQLGADNVTRAEMSTAYHLIKLRML